MRVRGHTEMDGDGDPCDYDDGPCVDEIVAHGGHSKMYMPITCMHTMIVGNVGRYQTIVLVGVCMRWIVDEMDEHECL
jgi:hypothetical protein